LAPLLIVIALGSMAFGTERARAAIVEQFNALPGPAPAPRPTRPPDRSWCCCCGGIIQRRFSIRRGADRGDGPERRAADEGIVLTRRTPLDPFLLALAGAIALASLLPCRGAGAVWLADLTMAVIAAMFFMYGVRLAPAALLAGLGHWRLQLLILACTFVLYPALGLALAAALPHALPRELWTGILFVCVLPSTVQSSIAFTSIAGGNVAAALCAATASNLLGTLLTPLLTAVVLHSPGQSVSLAQVVQIVSELLLPFALGQAFRPWLGAWAGRHRAALTFFDRGSILLVVYSAFSSAVIGGLWQRLTLATLALLLPLELSLLAAVLLIAHLARRAAGLDQADGYAVLFCGSKKSLAAGVPMANVLFTGSAAGMTVLPLMVFHQLQLVVASSIAARAARQPPSSQPSAS
jgi:sodium/bile acid cotransporter 7